MRTRRPLLLGAVALMALPATSLAHDATVTCDATSPNGYRVTADFTYLNPQPTFTDTTVTVLWADGFRVVLPLPLGCVAPPVVPPAPPEQPVVPVQPPAPVSSTPQGTTPGAPEPMPRKRVTPRKPVRVTCAYLLRHRAGPGSYLARGYYYKCRAPKPPRKYLARVPVTG